MTSDRIRKLAAVKRVQQSAGYSDVVVDVQDDMTVLTQRGAKEVLLDGRDTAVLRAAFVEAARRSKDGSFKTYAEKMTLSVYGDCHLRVDGRDSGNTGDWTLFLPGVGFRDLIQGGWSFEEMAQALS